MCFNFQMPDQIKSVGACALEPSVNNFLDLVIVATKEPSRFNLTERWLCNLCATEPNFVDQTGHSLQLLACFIPTRGPILIV
jgi:hypothetical protein